MKNTKMTKEEHIRWLTYLFEKMSTAYSVFYDELVKRGVTDEEMAELIEKANYQHAKDHPEHSDYTGRYVKH